MQKLFCSFSAFFSNSAFRRSIAFEILCGGTWKDSLEISRIDEKTFFTKQETLQPSYNIENLQKLFRLFLELSLALHLETIALEILLGETPKAPVKAARIDKNIFFTKQEILSFDDKKYSMSVVSKSSINLLHNAYFTKSFSPQYAFIKSYSISDFK